MRNISSRIKQIIKTLLNVNGAVPVNDLSVELRVSRRTVFRELANTESFLNSFGLRLGTKSGEGVYIEGDDQNRQSLRKTIKRMGDDRPTCRVERRLCLLLTLLRDSELNKLVRYADKFDVSISTISNDLNEIERWLKEYEIVFSRGTGTGISVSGEEMSFRRAVLGIINNGEKYPFAIQKIIQTEVRDYITFIDKKVNFSKYMPPYFKEHFELYLNIMVQRIELGKTIYKAEKSDIFLDLANEISDLIEPHFSLEINSAERYAISLELLACSANIGNFQLKSEEYTSLMQLSHQLIDSYDVELAPLLKLDMILQESLFSHLRSAIIRWQNKIEFNNSLTEQLAVGFPAILNKTKRAVERYESNSYKVAESEISLLTSIFAVAEYRISYQLLKSKNICIGVICIYGISTSYLLASQIRKHFPPEVKFEVGCWNDVQNGHNYDFLISTTPIPSANVPVVEVPLILTSESIQQIGIELSKVSFGNKSRKKIQDSNISIPEYYGPIENAMTEARLMISKFQSVSVRKDINFEELASMASNIFGYSQNNRQSIYQCLVAREKISTQVLEELKLILMHCQTDGVKSPVLGLIVPEGGVFLNPYFKGVKSCVVIIVPQKPSKEEIDMIGTISSSIINNKIFLSDIIDGDGRRVHLHLEMILKQYLQQSVSSKLYN